jgi:hypothetical protein
MTNIKPSVVIAAIGFGSSIIPSENGGDAQRNRSRRRRIAIKIELRLRSFLFRGVRFSSQ